jgi:hypothetical protein
MLTCREDPLKYTRKEGREGRWEEGQKRSKEGKRYGKT